MRMRRGGASERLRCVFFRVGLAARAREPYAASTHGVRVHAWMPSRSHIVTPARRTPAATMLVKGTAFERDLLVCLKCVGRYGCMQHKACGTQRHVYISITTAI